MKILLVEDEKDIAVPLKRGLLAQGFMVDHVDNGHDALNATENSSFDCILLDLNLPGIDGIEVCKRLRERGVDIPVIMVTARSQQYDKLSGFDIGADDYITKPFDFMELVARLRAVTRRSSENKQHKLVFSFFEILPEQLSVVDTRKNHAIDLTNKEMGVLEYLFRNSERFVAAEELLEHVWDSEIDVFTETVKTHIKTLRQKLGKEVVETARGKGYRLSM